MKLLKVGAVLGVCMITTNACDVEKKNYRKAKFPDESAQVDSPLVSESPEQDQKQPEKEQAVTSDAGSANASSNQQSTTTERETPTGQTPAPVVSPKPAPVVTVNAVQLLDWYLTCEAYYFRDDCAKIVFDTPAKMNKKVWIDRFLNHLKNKGADSLSIDAKVNLYADFDKCIYIERPGSSTCYKRLTNALAPAPVAQR